MSDFDGQDKVKALGLESLEKQRLIDQLSAFMKS